MFKNYFKIAIRNVTGDKTYSTINIAGLAIGIAACLLLFTVVRYRLGHNFVSCLGLYGLVSFMPVQRTKEIGIRKVLGASVRNIIYLFSKEFTVLIILGFLVAAPVAYFMMNNWLEHFVFRIPFSTGVFIIAILAPIIIAWLTVGYKSFTALRNPVVSLKSE